MEFLHFIFILFGIEIPVCRQRSVVSNLGLHCLPRSQKLNAGYTRDNTLLKIVEGTLIFFP